MICQTVAGSPVVRGPILAAGRRKYFHPAPSIPGDGASAPATVPPHWPCHGRQWRRALLRDAPLSTSFPARRWKSVDRRAPPPRRGGWAQAPSPQGEGRRRAANALPLRRRDASPFRVDRGRAGRREGRRGRTPSCAGHAPAPSTAPRVLQEERPTKEGVHQPLACIVAMDATTSRPRAVFLRPSSPCRTISALEWDCTFTRNADRSLISARLPCLVRSAVRATDGRNAVTEQDNATETASEMAGGRQAHPISKGPARGAARWRTKRAPAGAVEP